MTMTGSNEYQNIHKTALLVSLACVLQISEALIPHPIPGLRLGLANVITLIALVTMGFRYALEITVLRALLSSFIMGTFMSPAFILSFSAGVVSTLVMGFFYGIEKYKYHTTSKIALSYCQTQFSRWLILFYKQCRLSIVGISVLGALTHNLVQIYLAYLIVVKHPGIFVFLPWLCIGAVVMGWVTGVLSGQVCLKIRQIRESGSCVNSLTFNRLALEFSHYFPGDSIIHRLPAELKITVIFILSLLVLIFSNFWLYLWLSLFLLVSAIISQVSFNFLFLRARKYSSLVFVSFLFPLFFNSGKHVLSQTAYFTITAEGLNTGVFFAWRILFLILISSLLVMVTSPRDLGSGFAKLLSLLRPLGISEKRTAAIISLSWIAVPVFWETAKNIIRGIDFKKIKNPRKFMLFFCDFIAKLYLEAEQTANF